MEGIKHLIECHCVLPQYRDKQETVYHKFVVFSLLDEYSNVVPKFSQCANCGVIHRIVGICISEVALGDEDANAVISIDDVKLQLPESLKTILESYQAEIATWEEVAFIIENEKWDQAVVLTRTEKDGVISGKVLRIKGPTSVKVEPYIHKTFVE